MQERKKHKKALSLVEMLIVLLIMSTAVVSAMALIVRSFVDIRENEVQDAANGILISVSEAVKSPSGIVIQNYDSPFPSNGIFFNIDDVAGNLLLNYTGDSSDIDDCEVTSVYYYHIGFVQSTLQNVCIQIKISNLSVGTLIKYQVDIRMIYLANNELNTSTLRVFRYANF